MIKEDDNLCLFMKSGIGSDGIIGDNGKTVSMITTEGGCTLRPNIFDKGAHGIELRFYICHPKWIHKREYDEYSQENKFFQIFDSAGFGLDFIISTDISRASHFRMGGMMSCSPSIEVALASMIEMKWQSFQFAVLYHLIQK